MPAEFYDLRGRSGDGRKGGKNGLIIMDQERSKGAAFITILTEEMGWSKLEALVQVLSNV